MKFKVQGFDRQSKLKTELTVDAPDKDQAKAKAEERGISVTRLTAAGGGALPVADNDVPPYRELEVIGRITVVVGGLGLFILIFACVWIWTKQAESLDPSLTFLETVKGAFGVGIPEGVIRLLESIPMWIGLMLAGFAAEAFRHLVQNSWRKQ